MQDEIFMNNYANKPELNLNYSELCEVMRELSAYTENKNILVHTDLHYDDKLSPISDFMVKNFSILKLNKLYIADFPLPESLETWYTMYENAYYEITASDRDITENPDVDWESLSHLYNSYEWNIDLCKEKMCMTPTTLVKESDLVVSFVDTVFIRPYLNFLRDMNMFNKTKYLIGCYAQSLCCSSFLEEIAGTSAHIYKAYEGTNHFGDVFDDSIVWITNIELPMDEVRICFYGENNEPENPEITMEDIFKGTELSNEAFGDESECSDCESIDKKELFEDDWNNEMEEDDCEPVFEDDWDQYDKDVSEVFAEEDDEYDGDMQDYSSTFDEEARSRAAEYFRKAEAQNQLYCESILFE